MSCTLFFFFLFFHLFSSNEHAKGEITDSEESREPPPRPDLVLYNADAISTNVHLVACSPLFVSEASSQLWGWPRGYGCLLRVHETDGVPFMFRRRFTNLQRRFEKSYMRWTCPRLNAQMRMITPLLAARRRMTFKKNALWRRCAYF